MLTDLKLACRQFRKSPGFCTVAIITLALGIGANTAIFSVVYAVLLEPLPYPHSDRLVQVVEKTENGGNGGVASGGVFIDWQDASTQLEAIAAYHQAEANLTGAGEPVRVSGLEVSAQYFGVFGIVPAFGRDFQPADDAPGGDHRVVIVSDELWRTHLGADASILGRTIHLDGEGLRVIGVLPPKALFGSTAGFFVPSSIRGSNARKLSRDYDYVVGVVGRLRPGATAARAAEELTRAKAGTRLLYPVFKQKWTVGVMPLHEFTFGNLRPYVLTLLAAVAVVLLIACANVANLLLARATSRQGEMALRTALGATPGRILRLLLTESIVLALAGGVAGLGLAAVAINPLVILTGIRESTGATIGINPPVLLLTLGASVLAGLGFGIVPALSAGRPNLNQPLKEGGRGSTRGRGRQVQGLILVSETALTVLLLVCAGLLLRSFVRALSARPGFNPDHVLVFNLQIPNQTAPSTADKVRLQQRLLERLAQLPGVTRVGLASGVPLYGTNELGNLVSREDRPETRNDSSAGFDSVGGDYFQTLGIPLLRGRFLTRQDDTEAAPKVVLINDDLARQFYGDGDPIGKYLHYSGAAWEIVGVVGSVRRYQLDYGTSPSIYFGRTYFPWRTDVVLRSQAAPLTLVAAVREAVHEVDPDLPLAGVQTMDEAVAATLGFRRSLLILLGVFAATALVLAGVGIYGVLSYSVAQRSREIGIRMALGAMAAQVIRLVIRQGLWLVLAGVGLGLLAAAGAGRLIASQLYEVSPGDPEVYGAVALALVAAAILACWLPARRASRVNPVVALRAD